ncbi:MAG: hypothetical protein Q6366_002750 [Candidatus Freyarchaeota archaeon]
MFNSKMEAYWKSLEMLKAVRVIEEAAYTKWQVVAKPEKLLWRPRRAEVSNSNIFAFDIFFRLEKYKYKAVPLFSLISAVGVF